MTSPRVSSLRLDAILSQAREPAFLLGPDRRLIGVNRAMEELTGQTADGLLGLVCRPHGPTRSGDPASLAGSLYPPPEAVAGRATGEETLILNAGGDWLTRRVEFWPFHDADGDLLGLFGLLRPLDDPPMAPQAGTQRLRRELLDVRVRLHDRHGLDSLIGRGAAHRRLLDQVRAASASMASVLIVGEPGTGKRTIARTIHALGPHAEAPILPLDCTALPPEVLSRELFGATDDDDLNWARRLVQPDGSTLLISDVLALPRDIQAGLAATLDGRVRLLATTTGDPDTALRDERCRPDFYFAITAMVLRIPPLRDRADELPILAQHFLERANRRGGPQPSGFTPVTIDALAAYDWPGNLRELARVIDSAQASATGDFIVPDDLPAAIRGERAGAYLPPPPPSPVPLDERLTQVERRLIEESLTRSRGNKSRAAELLGISRPRLYRRIKELGIPDESELPAVPVPIDNSSREGR